MKAKHKNNYAVFDGNEAAAYSAYRTNELCVIYPITPSSGMGEFSDLWSANYVKNIWGTTPEVVTMQSEAGAAGAVHGALQIGALATTFTASQGLLLMIPNMYTIAGDLTPTVFHVAARSVAFQGMSIYGDHSDIYAARSTGFAILASSGVQEAHDMALVAQAASLKSRIPFLHFFDGFRTSHEVAKIELLSEKQIKGMISDKDVIKNRERKLTPMNPSVRGVVADHDVFFQGREAHNPFYNALPKILEETLRQFKKTTGRPYKLAEYIGDPKAKYVIVAMGSATETIQETVEHLNKTGGKEKFGLIKIRLFRPFPKKQFIKALPKTCKKIAVLDRAKEPGAAGEPLYEEVSTTILENYADTSKPKIIGGRFGLASKDFSPAMVKSIFDELKKASPKNNFTVGINDDVTNTSLKYDKNFDIEPDKVFRALFYGLGADGTVGANRNTIKIIGEETKLFGQAYFVFDAKKTGSKTTSHLRFSPKKIRSSHLINKANFIGCHQFNFIEKIPVLERASDNATFLLNSPLSADDVWNQLPYSLQKTIIDKKIKFYVVDAYKIAHKSGMGNRINTIMQTCFFALSNVIPLTKAISKIKEAIEKTYHSKGESVLQKNYAAVDSAISGLKEVTVPKKATSKFDLLPAVSNKAPKFVKDVIGTMIAGKGDDVPVSALPCNGVYKTNTTCWEKRNAALNIPGWIPEDCIQCGQCSFVCPHSAIRAKCYSKSKLAKAPKNFLSAKAMGQKDLQFTLQVYPEDCTGCGSCVAVCPINKNKTDKIALTTQEKTSSLKKQEISNVAFFEKIENEAVCLNNNTVKNIQHKKPMFEFCCACAGCGEAPYIKVLSQLFGKHLVIADACGCTLVYGGYLPTTPWTVAEDGRGPAFAASLFEDNAEFGYGFLLTIEKHKKQALELIEKLKPKIKNKNLINKITTSEQKSEKDIDSQIKSVSKLKDILKKIKTNDSKQLLSLADNLIKQSVWAIGGDGWAYDIGYGGLDHVLASGKNMKVLVLDTEVYSNTGGQSSKATPRGAVAKFAASGKPTAKKDLGLMLIPYGNIYVASVAMGANPTQTIKAIEEAEKYDGPAIVIAYSHCISHGIDMSNGMEQQKLAVKCGHWPLYRYNPDRAKEGLNPLQLDSEKPSIPFEEYAKNENRYQSLMRTNPNYAKHMIKLAQKDIEHRLKIYEALSKIDF